MNMRQPSIHITQKNLHTILESLDIPNSRLVTHQIMHQARRVSCDNRIVTISNEKLNRKVDKILKSDKGDASLMANLYYSVRKRMRHKGVKKYQQGEREWPQIKGLAKVANDFCNDFGLGKREGYILYLEIGLKKISSPRNIFSKLTNMFETISITHEAELEIQNCDVKSEVKDIHDIYVNMIANRTGIVDTYYDKPLLYVMFLKVYEITEKLNIDPKVYLESQFEGLLWTSGYPDPYQLISEKSSERLNKYMYENKLTTNKKEVKQTNFNKILQDIKNVSDRD